MTETSTEIAQPGSWVLALVASVGRGGGIETYVRGVVEALEAAGVRVCRVALTDGGAPAGPRQKLRFLIQAMRTVQRQPDAPVAVLCFHPGLLPVALLCRRLCPASPVRVFTYGIDIWSMPRTKRLLLRHCQVHLTAASDFSAGTLLDVRPASVLAPALPQERYQLLAAVGEARESYGGDHLRIPTTFPLADFEDKVTTFRVLSVFRLEDFEDKGGWNLINAVQLLRSQGHDVTLTLAGAAQPSACIPAYPEDLSWLSVISNPSDQNLSELYLDADLFVLASRLGIRPYAYGEGFGIVLIEAALAGLPIVAPWGGGSHAAMVEGVTGLRPTDPSVEALAATIRWFVVHSEASRGMGRNGHLWASAKFDPSKNSPFIADLVLARTPTISPTLDLKLTKDA